MEWFHFNFEKWNTNESNYLNEKFIITGNEISNYGKMLDSRTSVSLWDRKNWLAKINQGKIAAVVVLPTRFS